MTYTYNIDPTEVFNAEARDFRPAFEVQYVRTSPAGDIGPPSTCHLH